MITKDNMEEILRNYFEGKSNASEIRAIDRWLDENTENRHVFATYKKTYIELQALAAQDSERVNRAYDTFVAKINKDTGNSTLGRRGMALPVRAIYMQLTAVAAAVLLAVAGTYFLINRFQKTDDKAYCEIEVPYGGRSLLILPDGSKVWLNAGSKFRYSRNFDIRSREVHLDGEAFFDVMKSKRPFVVNTSHLKIHVTGTSFNVKSYIDDQNIETTLVEGSIRIEQKNTEASLYLKPKQKLIFTKKPELYEEVKFAPAHHTPETIAIVSQNHAQAAESITIEANINTDETISWKDGKLIINNEPLEKLVVTLGRKYDIVFRFENEELEEYSYSGTLRDFPLEQVLKALSLTSPIKYTIQEKTVYLSYNKHFKPLSSSGTRN